MAVFQLKMGFEALSASTADWSPYVKFIIQGGEPNERISLQLKKEELQLYIHDLHE